MRKFFNRLCIPFTCVISILMWQASALTVYALPTITDVEERTAIPIESNTSENWPEGPIVSAQSAILMDAETGAVLYEKNIHEQLYPASTTKILTCLIAAEQCSLDEIVTFSYDAVHDAEGSSIALDAGEQLTMEQCLNAILIASANEVAYGVAEHITGTCWEDFAPIMNEKAAELGCVDSNFANPNGLPDENHYTSAYDLATIGRAFFANDLLCKISSTPTLDIPPTENQPDHIIEHSRNQLFAGKPYEYEYLVGSKTGYTSAAGNTLVSCAEKDGMKLIAVVMVEDSPAQFADTIALFNYGFNNFEKVNISETETRFNIDNASFFYSDNDIFGSSKPILSLNKADCIILPKTIAFAEITSTISYDTAEEGTAALITYTYEDRFLGSASVDFADTSIPSYTFEEGAMQPVTESASAENTPEQKIVYINIVNVVLWIIGIAGVAVVIIIICNILKNYHFSKKERGGRKNWLKRQRQKRNRYQLNSLRRRQIIVEKKRSRRRARKSRHYRDLDF